MNASAIGLVLEAAGCPTTCIHCWAQGRSYPAMPLEDVEWVLAEASHFCADRGLAFSSFPMHEVAAHPDAAAVLDLYKRYVGAEQFEPLTTTGVPLATRDDWREVLAAAAAVGTTTVWVAFHGVGEEHDRQVNRAGAFAETCLAVERIHAAGLRAGCNVFLTKTNLARVDPLAEALRRLALDEISLEVAAYYPTARSRRYETVRPESGDLRPHVETIKALCPPYWRGWWDDLEASTEAAYVSRALARVAPARSQERDASIALVCRPTLDVHTGLAGRYGERLGNLRADGVAAVLERAVEGGARTYDEMWFGAEPLPDDAQLAASFGEPEGRGVHPRAQSVRYLWADRGRRARHCGGGPIGDISWK